MVLGLIKVFMCFPIRVKNTLRSPDKSKMSQYYRSEGLDLQFRWFCHTVKKLFSFRGYHGYVYWFSIGFYIRCFPWYNLFHLSRVGVGDDQILPTTPRPLDDWTWRHKFDICNLVTSHTEETQIYHLCFNSNEKTNRKKQTEAFKSSSSLILSVPI